MCEIYDRQREMVRSIVQEFCAKKRTFCARDVREEIRARHLKKAESSDDVSRLVRQQFLIGAMPDGYIMQMVRVPHPKSDSNGSRTFCVYRYSRYAKEFGSKYVP